MRWRPAAEQPFQVLVMEPGRDIETTDGVTRRHYVRRVMVVCSRCRKRLEDPEE